MLRGLPEPDEGGFFQVRALFCANQEWQDWQNWQFQQNRQDVASEKKGMEWIKMQDLKS